MWKISDKRCYQNRHFSRSPLVTFSIWHMYDTPDRGIKKSKSGYTLKNEENLKDLLFMDDLKIFAISEREVNELFSTVQILSMILGWNLEQKSVVYLY